LNFNIKPTKTICVLVGFFVDFDLVTTTIVVITTAFL